MHTALIELRLALRRLRRSPLFAVASILILGLGIAAYTTVFSTAWAALLRPLPYPDENRLFAVESYDSRKSPEERAGLSRMELFAYSEEVPAFESVAAYEFDNFLAGAGDKQIQVRAARVNRDFFRTLQGKAARGRVPEAKEHVADPARVVVLSDGTWKSLFGGMANVEGQTLVLDGESYEVAGVMPQDFEYPGYELWLPMREWRGGADFASGRRYTAIARLREGASAGDAAEQLRTVTARLAKEFPRTNEHVAIQLVPLREFLFGDTPRLVSLLVGAVALLMLIAVANLSGLLVARHAERRREMAVRAAMGGGRRDFLRMLLAETLLLGLGGGVVGLTLSAWTLAGVLRLAPYDITKVKDIGIDVPVFLASLGFALLCSLAMALAPALRRPSANLAGALKEGGRTAGGAQSHRTRNLLVAGQFALTLVLLFGAALMVQSVRNLSEVALGFDAARLFSAGLVMPPNQFPSPASRASHLQSLIENVRSQPEVEAAAAGNFLPLWRNEGFLSFEIEGKAAPAPADRPTAGSRVVTEGYFETMGIPLVAGRTFGRADTLGSPGAAVLNRKAAETYFPDENPVGRQLRFQGESGSELATVVGVVGDVRHGGLRQPAIPEIYFAHAQNPWTYMNLVVRTRPGAEAAALEAPVRRAVEEVDPGRPLFAISTFEALVKDYLHLPRFLMALLCGFAAYALALSLVGLYAVIAYTVARRRREIGIRMAMGATARSVLRLVLRGAVALVAGALPIGMILSVWLSAFLESQVFEVSFRDPWTLVAVMLALAGAGVAAALLPAWEAARLNPMVALKED